MSEPVLDASVLKGDNGTWELSIATYAPQSDRSWKVRNAQWQTARFMGLTAEKSGEETRDNAMSRQKQLEGSSSNTEETIREK